MTFPTKPVNFDSNTSKPKSPGMKIEMTTIAEGPVRIPEIDVRKMLGDDLRAYLRLDEQIYTLRITRNGKLILTK